MLRALPVKTLRLQIMHRRSLHILVGIWLSDWTLNGASCRKSKVNVQNMTVRGRCVGYHACFLNQPNRATWCFAEIDKTEGSSSSRPHPLTCPEPSYFAHWGLFFDKMVSQRWARALLITVYACRLLMLLWCFC